MCEFLDVVIVKNVKIYDENPKIFDDRRKIYVSGRFKTGYNPSQMSVRYQKIEMRGSPINNLRSQQENMSPLQRGTIRRMGDRIQNYEGSPERLSSQLSQVQYWKLRARKYENEVVAINEELMFLNRKLLKLEELQEKIQVLLRQNTHLVEENQALLKVIQQKKNEADSWRLKFDSEFNATNALESEARKAYDNLNIQDQEHRIEVDKLTAEISRLHDQLEEVEKLKQLEIEGLKNKYEVEALSHIQNLKRSQQGNTELYEMKIQKLKEALDGKHFELETQRKQSKLEAERLNAEICFLKNDIKKVEQQKEYEIDLLKAENDNNVRNLTRTHKKNEDDMKGLYENKIKRLGFDLEEKKVELEESLARIKKTGKDGELEIVRLLEDKDRLRLDMKEESLRSQQEIADQAKFYENQLNAERDAANSKELNIKTLLEGELDRLKRIIQTKQREIEAVLNQSKLLKQADDNRVQSIKKLNNEIRDKFAEMVLHYEREIELLKIKVSKLYEADIETLRNLFTHQLEQMNNENAKLKDTLTQTKDRLIQEIEEKLLMRKDYENRLNDMNVKFDREHKQLNDLLVLAEKNYENVRSQTSIRDIEHGSKLKRHNTSINSIMVEKRNLENQIKNKNKEIEELNLRIEKMNGYHKRDLEQLQNRLNEEQVKYKKFLDEQAKTMKAAAEEAEALRETVKNLEKKLREAKAAADAALANKDKEIEEKRLKIANLEGAIEELKRQHGHLDSKLKVEVGNMEKTNLELTAIMNSEKEKLEKIRETDKGAIRKDYDSRIQLLNKDLADLNKQIQALRQSYEEEKLKSRKLEVELAQAYKSVDERSKLEDHVINIGLSNNYFKNIAQVFKKRLSE